MDAREKRRSTLIILVAWLAYLFSYIGRSDYSACLLEIVNTTGVDRATAGMVSSVFALCNAFGQLASGFVMKKVSPLKVITAEIFTVCVINFLFPLTNSFLLMAALWGINGAMQATLLCGLTQIFANTLQEPHLSRGAVLLNTVGAMGGMFNYVLTFILIRYFSWKAVFFTVSGLLVVIGVVWCIVMPGLTRSLRKEPAMKPVAQKAPTASLYTILRSYGTVYVIVGAFFVGGLRESVSLWIPSYMEETFRLGSDVSTVITAVVPCMQVCGAFLGGALGRRSKTLQFPAAIAFTLSTICLMLIRVLGSLSPAVTIALFALNAISMTAALTLLLSLFPVRYVASGSVAVLVGIINFSVHGGDFAASVGLGWLSRFGWNSAFLVLCAAATIGGALCLLGGLACLKEEKKNGEKRVCS